MPRTGRILDRLAQLGLDEHTIVVFTSDNGPWLLMGDHGGTKGAFREGKATTFEGGVRMPALIRAPGQILAGQVIDEACHRDGRATTVLELAGIEGRDRFDGASLASALTGKSELDANRPLFFYRSGQLRSMRKGKWKTPCAAYLYINFRGVRRITPVKAGIRERTVLPSSASPCTTSKRTPVNRWMFRRRILT